MAGSSGLVPNPVVLLVLLAGILVLGALIYALVRYLDRRAMTGAAARSGPLWPWWAAASVAGLLLLIGLILASRYVEHQRVLEAAEKQSHAAAVKRLEALLAIDHARDADPEGIAAATASLAAADANTDANSTAEAAAGYQKARALAEQALARAELAEAAHGAALEAIGACTQDADPADVAAATAALDAGDAQRSAKAYAEAAASYQKAKELAERAASRAAEAPELAQAARRAAEEALGAAQAIRQERTQALLQAWGPGASLAAALAVRGMSLETYEEWTGRQFVAAEVAIRNGDHATGGPWASKTSYEQAKAFAEEAAVAADKVAKVFAAAAKAVNSVKGAERALGILPQITGSYWTSSEFEAIAGAWGSAVGAMRARAYDDALQGIADTEQRAAQIAATAEPLGVRLTAVYEAASLAAQNARDAEAGQFVPVVWKSASDLFSNPAPSEPGGIIGRLERTIEVYARAKELFERATAVVKAMKLAEAFAASLYAPTEWQQAQDALNDAKEGNYEDARAEAQRVTELFERAAVAAEAALVRMLQAASEEYQVAARELGATMVARASARQSLPVPAPNENRLRAIAAARAYTLKSVPPPVQKDFEALESATHEANAAHAALLPHLFKRNSGTAGDTGSHAAEELYAAVQHGGQPIATTFLEAREKQLRAKAVAERLTRVLKALEARVHLRDTPASLSLAEVIKLGRERFGLPTTTFGWPPAAGETVEDFQNVYELQELRGDKVVIDHRTGLMWVQSRNSTLRPGTWPNAAEHLELLNSKSYGGFSDWRLPTIEELLSLVEITKNSRGEYMDELFDLNWGPRVVWTADTSTSSSDLRWVVEFTPEANVRPHPASPFASGGSVLAVRKKP